MTEIDISSIDNKHDDAKKKKAKTGKSSKSLKKTNNESNSDVQCICKGTGKSSLIQCSWCQMWLHVTCVNLSEKETIGFLVCPTCRELPRTVIRKLYFVDEVELWKIRWVLVDDKPETTRHSTCNKPVHIFALF
jgi:hypothetical protein